MAQSIEILHLLDLLDETGLDIGFLWGFVHDESVREGGALSDFYRPEDVKDTKQTRDLLKALVKSKQGHTSIAADELTQRLSSVVKDGHLDEAISRLELQKVPGIVARWKKLRTISVFRLPGENVTAYLRQACTCYLYGLPDATAALCRSVLQFALEEKLAEPGGMSLDLISRLDKKDSLEALINFFRMRKALPPELATKAHSIRRVGNNSLHTSSCSESKALTTIKDTAEVLSYIYGRGARRDR